MGTAVAIVYLVGCLAAAGVGRYRSGLSQRGRLPAGTVLTSLPWFLSQVGSMLAWPVVLGVWIARGRPDSPWKATTNPDGHLRIRRHTPR